MEPKFDAPIPGMSMTAELGSRPWQSPPKLADVDSVIDYYIERMSTDEFTDQLVDIMEMGIPLTDVAHIMQLAHVMEGVHTIDVGILVSPVLVEMMMLIGDSEGIEYDSGVDKKEKTTKVRDSLVTKTLRKLETELNMSSKEDINEEEEEEIVDIPANGLMARRN
tara:strand:+ start:2695 stop:3189 length:495 start_codon:yes stop_codon:yes gene_type:complete